MSRRVSRFLCPIQLERRIVPAVTAVFDSILGKLTIDGDSLANHIRVFQDTGIARVTDHGLTVAISPAGPLARDVVIVEVNGNDGADTIDLSGVFAADFNLQNRVVGGKLIRPARINAGPGNNAVLGAPNVGNQIILGDGNNTVRGGAQTDFIGGGAGADTIDAGAGDDEVQGGAGDDVLNGGAGNDTVDGGAGSDIMNGGAGNDQLTGEVGDKSLNGGGQPADVARVVKKAPAGVPLLIQVNAADNSLKIIGGTVTTELPFPSSVVVEDKSGENQPAQVKVENVELSQDRVVELSNDHDVDFGDILDSKNAVQLALRRDDLTPGQAFQIFFAAFPALEVEPGDAPDRIAVEPLTIPVTIKAGAGNDTLTIETDGLATNQTANKVEVAGRAPIEHVGVEQVEIDDTVANFLSMSIAESADPAFIGEVVRYTVTFSHSSPDPFRVHFLAASNYPIVGVTSSVASRSGTRPADPLAGDDATATADAVTDGEITAGSTVTLVFTVLADRVGMIQFGVEAFPLTILNQNRRLKKTETTEVRAGIFDRVKLINKDEATGKSATGNHSLISIADNASRAVFSSDSKSFDANAKFVDHPGTDTYLFLADPVLISTGADGQTSSNSQISGARLSRNGRFVTFSSNSSNLIAGLPGNTQSQIWLRDLDSNSIRMVSFNSAGAKGGGAGSTRPAVSEDGRWVAFESSATDLVAGFVDGNGSFSSDVFLRDMLTGQTILVSRSSASATTGGKFGSSNPIVSGDGRFVVFESQADNLIAGLTDNTFTTNLFVFDRVAHTTKMIDARFDGLANGTDSVPPQRARISLDGSVIIFESTSTNLLGGFVDNNGFGADIYAYATATGTLSLVSGPSAINSGNSGAQRANLSADGSTVAWISAATDLVPGITNGVNHIYVRDLKTGAMEVATIAADGVTAGNGSVIGTIFAPELSEDGRFVAFMSAAKNLVSGYVDGNTDDMDLFVRDRLAKVTTLVNSADGITSGDRGHESSSRYFLSASGDAVVFDSRASNLIADDTNAAKDIFTVRDHVRFSFAAPTGIPLTLRRNGANLEVLNTTTSALLASRNATATFEMNITGLDSTLTIDFAAGNIILPNGLTVVGDSINAKITIVGGAFAQGELAVSQSSLRGGVLSYDDLAISLFGMAGITDSATVLDRRHVGTSLNESLLVLPVAGQREIVGGPGPNWKFNDPVTSLTIDTGAGHDSVTVFTLAAGYDTTIEFIAIGGAGNDTFNAASAGRRVTLIGGAGNDTLTGGVGADRLADGSGDDSLTGGVGSDAYVLTPGSADTVTDSGGTDTLDFSFSDRPVSVDYRIATPQLVTVFGDTLTITGQIENIVGSIFNDTVTLAPLSVGRDVGGNTQVLGIAVGDTLVVDCQGQIGVNAGGQVSVPGFADVIHANFELVSLINTGGVTPAKVTSLTINDGSPQRSRVTNVKLTFDNPPMLPVNVAVGFQLKRQSDGATVALSASASGDTVTLTFTGGAVESASLANGRYTLTALASQIANLDGDGNGTVGDDFVQVGTPANGLFRLFGDADGDGTVGSADFLAFRLAFLSNSATFDVDEDGTVGVNDFLRFRINFLASV